MSNPVSESFLHMFPPFLTTKSRAPLFVVVERVFKNLSWKGAHRDDGFVPYDFEFPTPCAFSNSSKLGKAKELQSTLRAQLHHRPKVHTRRKKGWRLFNHYIPAKATLSPLALSRPASDKAYTKRTLSLPCGLLQAFLVSHESSAEENSDLCLHQILSNPFMLWLLSRRDALALIRSQQMPHPLPLSRSHLWLGPSRMRRWVSLANAEQSCIAAIRSTVQAVTSSVFHHWALIAAHLVIMFH